MCHRMGETWKHYAKRKQPDTKGQILHDSNHTKCLLEAQIHKEVDRAEVVGDEVEKDARGDIV